MPFMHGTKTSLRVTLAPHPNRSAELAASPPRRCEKIGLRPFPVIPAQAGIQDFQALKDFLDPGFHRGDDKKAIFSHLSPRRGREGWG